MKQKKPSLVNRRKFLALASTGAVGVMSWGPATSAEPQPHDGDKDTSWLEIKNQIYGAKPDATGPIGGGQGYTGSFTRGEFEVSDVGELLQALSKVRAGQVIFLPSDTIIDLTTMIYIEQLVLEIPAGVVLAGDRGINGSQGALICSDALATKVMFRALDPGVRITGIRLEGPNPKRHMEHHSRSFGPTGLGREYYYRFPVSRGIETSFPIEIDNCELTAFSQCAVYLKDGSGHHIHHNSIHQCQYNGLGYGVSHHTAFSVIEYNLFNENRHSIAGTGASGSGYIARHNIESGISLSHCFDMHGGRDRKDGTEIAGTSIEIYNNTFRAPQRAVVIRGIPEEKCEVYQNWFMNHKDVEEAVGGMSDKTIAFNNVYGKNPSATK